MLGAFRLRSERYRGIVGEIFRFDPNDSGALCPTQGDNAGHLRLIRTNVGLVGRHEKRLTLTGAARDYRSQLVELSSFVLFGYQPRQLIAPNTMHHLCLRLAGHSKS